MRQVPPDWKRPAGRPSHTWLRAIEADLGPLNFGLATAWRKATYSRPMATYCGHSNAPAEYALKEEEDGRYRGALHQARSKPSSVDQPVRTARTGTVVHRYNGTQYSSVNIPFTPDQHHILDVAKCR